MINSLTLVRQALFGRCLSFMLGSVFFPVPNLNEGCSGLGGSAPAVI